MCTVYQSLPGYWGSFVVLKFLMVDTHLTCPFSSITMWEADMHPGLQNSWDWAWIWFCHLPDGGHQMSWFNPLHSMFSLVKESIWMTPRFGIWIKFNMKYLSPSPVQKNQSVTIIPFISWKFLKNGFVFIERGLKVCLPNHPCLLTTTANLEHDLIFRIPAPTLSPCGILKERHN